MVLYFAFSGLFNAVVSTLLGIFILYKNKKNKVNRTFALFCATVALWSYPYIGWPLASTANETLFWFQLLHIGACFTSIAYFHFVVNWLNLYKQKRIIVYCGYFLAVFFASFVFSSLFISGMEPKFSMNFWAKPGVLYHFYLLYFFGYSIYSSYLLYSRFKISIGVRKQQIKYILIGIALSFAGGSTNYFLWYDINFPPYGNILASAYVVLTAYAIIVHRLMDIKFILRRSSVYLTSLSTILILAVSAQYISIIFFPNLATWINVLILILAVSFFPIIKNHYYHFANKYFFTSLYDSKKVIADLSDKLRSTLKIENIYKYISETFINSFHTKAVGILIQNKQVNQDKKGDDQYIVQYNKGFNVGKCKVFPGNKKLCHLFMRDNKSIVIEELKRTAYKKHKKTIDLLTKFGVEIVTPLNVKDQTIGLIVLGRKESGDMYNNEDLSVLKIIGAQAAIAIENALLYKETKNFAIKLKKEVQKATADLKTANLQLRKLDAAKSDFISIASHQLRTPLTVIKGYISMMIEGSFGKVTKEELESLKKVYESNERLIRLVEDLLNISRIESGKLQFDFQETRLEEVIKSVAEELAGSAKQKGLRFAYKKPDQPLPMVKIDGEKIRYVILNLIDNAIKYTKQGSITVNVRLGAQHIYFCVVDTGIGISKEDLSNLFKKFSRGKNISIVHPEGTGMGLYVGRMMIKAHRGKIWVESEGEGRGSKFCFKLPVSRKTRKA